MPSWNLRALAPMLLLTFGCGSVASDDLDAGPDDPDAAGGSDARSDATGGSDAPTVDAAPEPGCATQFVPWFEAGFELPEGGTLGAADFPSSPWRTVSGSVTPQDGRARSNSSAVTVASQGKVLAGAALRVRYTFVAAANNHKVSTTVNAGANGEGGLELAIDAATGELGASENGTPLGATTLGALTAGTVYFIEGIVDGNALALTLATGNYASVPGATQVGKLTAQTVAGSSTGSFTGMRFTGGGSVDDLSVALCGQSPPAYQRKFFDDFERANSTAIGSAVMPSVPWTGDNDNVRISSGRLDFTSSVTVRANGGHLSNQGLRVRASARLGAGGWLLLSVNNTSDGAGGMAGSFDIWRQSATQTFVEYGGSASGSSFFQVPLDPATFYFLEFAIDGSQGNVTVRSTSHEGPVLFALSTNNIPDPPAGNTFVTIGEVVGGTVAVEDFVVEQYLP